MADQDNITPDIVERLNDLDDDALAGKPLSESRISCVCADAAYEIERLRGQGWQPVETAPKDGTEVLLLVERRAGIKHGMLVGHYMPGGHCIEDHPPIEKGWYFWDGNGFDIASKPIHWMPLPPAPEGE